MIRTSRRLTLFLHAAMVVASLVGCEQQPAPTETEQATQKPSPTETSQPTEVLPSPTATEEATGQLEPFKINQNPRRRDDFGIIISADRRHANAGEPVRIRFTVVNRGDDEEIREAEEGPILDILVRYDFGSYNIEEWWSEGRDIGAEMRRLELAPGDSKTIEWTWIPWDEDYMAPIDIYGVFHDQYGETKVHTIICMGEACPEY